MNEKHKERDSDLLEINIDTNKRVSDEDGSDYDYPEKVNEEIIAIRNISHDIAANMQTLMAKGTGHGAIKIKNGSSLFQVGTTKSNPAVSR